MAISSIEPLENDSNGAAANGERPVPPEPAVWPVPEQLLAPFVPAHHGALPDCNTIVIDNGSSHVRAGWANQRDARLSFPPMMSRYRDRKFARTFTFVGNDVYIDQSSRGQMRSAFEAGSGIVGNWDVMEGILDYIFLKLGLGQNDAPLDRHIVMTEPVANLGYSRRMMTEILFECYNAPSVTFGVDCLFSHYQNTNGASTSGLVVSSSNSSTHLVPVINGKGILANATRLNWGRSHSVDYMQKLLQLKYPNFPGKINSKQVEAMVDAHCYTAQDYVTETSSFLDWTGLETRDVVAQFPFTEQVVVQKTEEELAKIAERKEENIRRLKEQAAKSRLERLKKKEEELAYYLDVQARGAQATKKELKRILELADLADENQLNKVIKELDGAIRKARQKDLGGPPEPEEPEEEPTFPLLDIPDEELDETGIKQKRHQKLMRSNHEARARARAEKEREKARIAEEIRLDEEKRTNNLDVWVAEHRAQRDGLLTRIKERQRLKADLSNRKSLASQMRMKSIANLASDNPSGKKRRRNANADDDNFGANDDDWGIYRSIAVGGGDGSDEENEDDELQSSLQKIEAKLLEHDPDFEEHHTLDAQSDWTKSLIHRFLRGPWPFEEGSARAANQMHLNVERIRVPEVIFRPSLAGLDQAGIVEIASDILMHRISSADIRKDVLKDVFLTGGNIMFGGFEERFQKELRAVLPADLELLVRKAKDPYGDAWRGACRWSSSEQARLSRVTRRDYDEKGAEYFKEHNLGNAFG